MQRSMQIYGDIVKQWSLADDQSSALFGAVSDPETRISYVVGIYKALHILLPDEYADQWMSRPNDNPLFRGQTPLDYIHGSKDLDGVQRGLELLEAQCQG